MSLEDKNKIVELYEQCLREHCSSFLQSDNTLSFGDLAVTTTFAILLLKNTIQLDGTVENILERTKREFEVINGE